MCDHYNTECPECVRRLSLTLRCECGHTAFWHNRPPLGCEDCVCTMFFPAEIAR